MVMRKEWKKEEQQVDKTFIVKGLCIREEFEPLMQQLYRLCGKNVNIDSDYIHSQSIKWLREAITEKEERDIEREQATNKNTTVVES